MADGVVQVAPDSTGKMLRTVTTTVGGNTVHEQVVIPVGMRTRQGAYRAHVGVFTVQASAHASTVGFWWLINPLSSGMAMGIKKISFSSQHGSVLATATSPRITIERTTFTGTATGTTVTPAKITNASGNGLNADATNKGLILTTSTGLTLTAGPAIKAFLPTVALTAVGVGPAVNDEVDPANEGDELILQPGEGIICRQPDAGTASDTRRVLFNVAWEEFGAP